MTHYLIVGCGAAATSAAETLRQADPSAEITLVSFERIRAVARPRLVEYAAGTLPLQDLETREPKWFDESRLKLRLETVADKLDAEAHEVHLRGGEILRYDRLLLAVGLTPRPLPFEGSHLKAVCHMHYLAEADQVREAVRDTRQAVVVGGGLVSQDMSRALRGAGREVTLLVRDDYVGVPQFDSRCGRLLEQELRNLGVEVRLKTEVARIQGGHDERASRVVTTDGQTLPCQLVFAGIGASPNVKWLASSGVTLARGIVVDEHLAAQAPDVFAAGSCAEIHAADRVVMQASWGNAVSQGKTAALNMLGGQEFYAAPSDYMTKVGSAKFWLFGSPITACPQARHVGFEGPDGSYGALLAEGGLVRGGILVGKHERAKEIKALQLRREPLPGLAELEGTQPISLSQFVAEALK